MSKRIGGVQSRGYPPPRHRFHLRGIAAWDRVVTTRLPRPVGFPCGLIEREMES